MREVDLSDEHSELARMIATIQGALERHIGNDHAHLMNRPEIEALVNKTASSAATAAAVTEDNRRKLALLIDTWKGPLDPLTGERHEDQGMESKVANVDKQVNELLKMARNGGVPAKVVSPQVHTFPVTDRTAIFVAAVSGFLALVTAAVVAYLQYS